MDRALEMFGFRSSSRPPSDPFSSLPLQPPNDLASISPTSPSSSSSSFPPLSSSALKYTTYTAPDPSYWQENLFRCSPSLRPYCRWSVLLPPLLYLLVAIFLALILAFISAPPVPTDQQADSPFVQLKQQLEWQREQAERVEGAVWCGRIGERSEGIGQHQMSYVVERDQVTVRFGFFTLLEAFNATLYAFSVQQVTSLSATSSNTMPTFNLRNSWAVVPSVHVIRRHLDFTSPSSPYANVRESSFSVWAGDGSVRRYVLFNLGYGSGLDRVYELSVMAVVETEERGVEAAQVCVTRLNPAKLPVRVPASASSTGASSGG